MVGSDALGWLLLGADQHIYPVLLGVIQNTFVREDYARMPRGVVWFDPHKHYIPTPQLHRVSPKVLCSLISAAVSFRLPAGAGGTSSCSS